VFACPVTYSYVTTDPVVTNPTIPAPVATLDTEETPFTVLANCTVVMVAAVPNMSASVPIAVKPKSTFGL